MSGTGSDARAHTCRNIAQNTRCTNCRSTFPRQGGCGMPVPGESCLSPGTAMPQPTRGARFGSCDITAHGNLDPPAGRALGFRLNPWIRLVGARSRSARSRARSESRRSESDFRNQKQKKKENRKRGNGKSKMGDGIHGVLATRNPKQPMAPPGPSLMRLDARQLKWSSYQLPPRNTRDQPDDGPCGFVCAPSE